MDIDLCIVNLGKGAQWPILFVASLPTRKNCEKWSDKVVRRDNVDRKTDHKEHYLIGVSPDRFVGGVPVVEGTLPAVQLGRCRGRRSKDVCLLVPVVVDPPSPMALGWVHYLITRSCAFDLYVRKAFQGSTGRCLTRD